MNMQDLYQLIKQVKNVKRRAFEKNITWYRLFMGCY